MQNKIEFIKKVNKILNKTINKVFDISLGNDQKVYLIESSSEKYILKIPKTDLTKIENEEFALTILSSLDIPIPKLIYKNSEFLIETYIEGSLLSKNDSDNLYIQLGRFINKIHSIKLNGFGEIKNGKGEHKREYEYLFSWLNLDKNKNNNLLEKYNFELFFKENLEIINSKYSYFLHGDISYSNIIINNNKITGIIDFGDSIAGPIEYDLALFFIQIQNDDNWEAFLKGYNKGFNKKKFDIYIIAFGIWLIQDDLIEKNDIQYKKFFDCVKKYF